MGAALSVAAVPAMAIAAASPAIESLSASSITQNDATLEAKIDPEGLETTYEFWLAYRTCQGPGVQCQEITEERMGEGLLAAGDDVQTVSADLTHLQPSYSYSYWAVASNTEGTRTTKGSSHEFKTFPESVGSPSIASESVSNVTEHDATLETQIDTNGRYTGYWFQIDTNSRYNFTQPDCPFDLPGYAECESITEGEPLPTGLIDPRPEYIPAGSGDQFVSLDLTSIGATLQPATTYHYRVLASSGGYPIAVGSDQTFTTPSQSTSSPSVPSGGGGLASISSAPLAAVNPSGLLAVNKAKASTNAQKLVKALKLCEKKPKKQRASCKKQAEKKYATTKKKKS